VVSYGIRLFGLSDGKIILPFLLIRKLFLLFKEICLGLSIFLLNPDSKPGLIGVGDADLY